MLNETISFVDNQVNEIAVNHSQDNKVFVQLKNNPLDQKSAHEDSIVPSDKIADLMFELAMAECFILLQEVSNNALQ